MTLFQSPRFQNSVNLIKINALLLCFFIGNSQLSYCQESLRLACQNDDSEIIGEPLDNSIVLKTGHFIPNVIPDNYAEDVIFRAIVDGGTPTEIYLLIDGEQHPLESKGINEGAGPAGTIYELEITPSLIFDKLVASDVFRVFVGFLEIYEGTQRVGRFNEFAQIWTPEIPVVPIKETANGIRHTSHVANITMDINRDNSGSTAYQAASKKFYAEFEDKFDFLSLVLFQGYNANRFHMHIQNEVRNIGIEVFNSSLSWGSQGRLLGANIFPLPGFYDGATHGYSHEIGHQWINFLRGTPYESGIPHWPICNHTHGVMGFSIAGSGAGGSFSNVLVPKDDGYAFIPDTTSSPGKFFQDMDLYLMGLISAEDIEDKLIFKPSTVPVVNQVYPESDFTKYTRDDLISDMGERMPDYTSSQKDFNMATLLISAEPLSDIEMYFYDFFTQRAMAELPLAVHEGFLKEVANPFYVSTRGLATLNTRLIECLNTESSISAAICQGEVFNLNGQTYEDSGTYTQILTNAKGCDSIITLQLAINDPPTLELGEDLVITTLDTVVIGVDEPSEFFDYSWNTGANSSQITIVASESGIGKFEFILTITDENNCEASDTITVTITEATSINPVPVAESIKVFPNPFSVQLFFDFELKESASVELELFDLIGRKVDTVYEGELNRGHQVLIWDQTDSWWPMGVYLYRIRMNDQLFAGTVILKR